MNKLFFHLIKLRLEALRGFATMSVFICHFTNNKEGVEKGLQLLDYGEDTFQNRVNLKSKFNFTRF
jgi:hypothetical protein